MHFFKCMSMGTANLGEVLAEQCFMAFLTGIFRSQFSLNEARHLEMDPWPE